MDNDEQRDYAEEKHNREFCGPCGTSPCSWDGKPDGFHTDEDGRTILRAARVTPWHGLARPDEALDDARAATLASIAEGEQAIATGLPLVTLDAVLAMARELDGWSPADLLGLVHTAGELWLSTGRADPDDVLNGHQRSLLERAAASHLAETGEDEDPDPETWVQHYDPETGVPLPGPPDTLREMREPS